MVMKANLIHLLLRHTWTRIFTCTVVLNWPGLVPVIQRPTRWLVLCWYTMIVSSGKDGTVNTVKHHLRHVYKKLKVQRRVQAVEEARLVSDVTRLQKLSDERDNQLKSVTVTNTGGAPNIQVLEPPTVLKNATRPRPVSTLVMALLAGAVIGCGVACVRDWYDFRLRSADEIKSALGVTVLGLIPHVEDETSPIARGQKIHIDPASEARTVFPGSIRRTPIRPSLGAVMLV